MKTTILNEIPHYVLDETGEKLYKYLPDKLSTEVCENWKNSKKSLDGRLALIDRDGVINEKAARHQYHASTDTIIIIKEAAKAIKYLNDKNIPVIIITNQPGIYKKAFNEIDLFNIDMHMQKQLELEIPNVKIDGIIYCPHKHPSIDPETNKILGCTCRKPAPGMLLTAMAMYGVPEAKTFMFGDFSSDIAAAIAANVQPIYIATIHDESEDTEQKIKANYPEIYNTKQKNLLSAAKAVFK